VALWATSVYTSDGRHALENRSVDTELSMAFAAEPAQAPAADTIKGKDASEGNRRRVARAND